MYCPEHKIFNMRFMSVWFYDSADRHWERVPLSLKINPLRYEVTFQLGWGKSQLKINREGMWARRRYSKAWNKKHFPREKE